MGQALRRISRRPRPLYISSGNIGLLYDLRRILCAPSKIPNAGRAETHAASRLAARPLGCTVGPQQLTFPRNLDPTRCRPLRALWLKTHASNDPRTSTVGEPPEGPPSLSEEIGHFSGNATGDFRGNWAGPRQEALRDHALRGFVDSP